MECRVDVYDFSWLQQLQLLVACKNQSHSIVVDRHLTYVECRLSENREMTVGHCWVALPGFVRSVGMALRRCLYMELSISLKDTNSAAPLDMHCNIHRRRADTMVARLQPPSFCIAVEAAMRSHSLHLHDCSDQSEIGTTQMFLS